MGNYKLDCKNIKHLNAKILLEMGLNTVVIKVGACGFYEELWVTTITKFEIVFLGYKNAKDFFLHYVML